MKITWTSGYVPSRLETLLDIMRSGKSIVFATAITIIRECGLFGQSKKLYMTFCFFVTSKSSSSMRTTLAITNPVSDNSLTRAEESVQVLPGLLVREMCVEKRFSVSGGNAFFADGVP